MRRAPERDVLAEEAVPHVVEREAEQGVAACERDQDRADGRVPALGDPDGGGRRLLSLRESDGDAAGGEDAEQADEDQVVGGVGERALVAADVDVERDVPVHAEQRDQERAGAHHGGEGRPAGHPGDALGHVGEPLEELALAGPVPVDQREEDRGGDERAGGGADDLADCRAAGGLGGLGSDREEAREVFAWAYVTLFDVT